MRPWLALCLALLTVAGSAAAQTPKRMSVPAAPALRGAQAPTAGAAGPASLTALSPGATRPVGGASAPLPAAPAPPLMSMLPQREPPACRTACARSYYLCLSGGDGPEDCARSFGQCVPRCDRTTG